MFIQFDPEGFKFLQIEYIRTNKVPTENNDWDVETYGKQVRKIQSFYIPANFMKHRYDACCLHLFPFWH